MGIRRRQITWQVECLESKRMLSATECAPCEDMADAQTGFLSAESLLAARLSPSAVDAIFDSPSASDSVGVSAEQRSTIFGPAEDIEITGGTQVVRQAFDSGPVDVLAFSLDEATPLQFRTSADINLVLYSLDFTRGPQTSHDGVLESELTSGDYLVYVYAMASDVDSYQLELTSPGQPSVPPELEEFPEVPYLGRDFDWNLNAVNAPEVWEQGYTGAGALVAVIDTGVDWSHPDLDDNIWRNQGEIAGDGIDNDRNGFVDDVLGWDFAYDDNDPSDVNGHGTHVAGTIAAERNGFGTTGVAYDAEILPIKVLRDNGVGNPNDIAAGIRYAVDVGADIINLSLGGGVTRAMQSALQYAWRNDVLVVAASGNDAASRPSAPAIYSSILSNTISVGAHDRTEVRSGFSNRVGGTSSVQIDAPGTRVASTAPNGVYRYLSGTSMATPHVAGVAALTVSANAELTAEDIRVLLVDGASRFVSGSDSQGGVNASRTVAQAVGRVDVFARGTSSSTGSSVVFSNQSVRTTSLTPNARSFVTSDLAAATDDLRRRAPVGILLN